MKLVNLHLLVFLLSVPTVAEVSMTEAKQFFEQISRRILDSANVTVEMYTGDATTVSCFSEDALKIAQDWRDKGKSANSRTEGGIKFTCYQNEALDVLRDIRRLAVLAAN